MNFNLFRFSGVFFGSLVAVVILITVESIFMVMVIDSALSNDLGYHQRLFRLATVLVMPIWVDFYAYILTFLLAAFSIAAYLEGFYFAKRQALPLGSLHLLSGSVAMGVVGTVLIVGSILGLVVLSQEEISFSKALLTPQLAFILATTVAVGALICRVFFGMGFREVRGPHSPSTGKQA